MQIMDERHEISTPQGQRIVSILLFEDLLIVPMPGDCSISSNPIIPMPLPMPYRYGENRCCRAFLVVLIATGILAVNPLF